MDSKFYHQGGEVIAGSGEFSSGFGLSAILVKMDDPKLASTRSDKGWIFIDPSAQLELLNSKPTITEQPCRICSRINDSSVAVCYWCGNKPW